MVNISTTNLPAATAVSTSDSAIINQGGVTKQAPISLFPTGSSSSGSGGGYTAGEHVVICSKSGSDSNDGLSWKTPVLTIQKALAVLGTADGKIQLGYGDFGAAAGQISLRATQMIQGVTTQGSDGGGSALVLTSSGTLINLDGQTNPILKDLTLKFQDSTITGKLVSMANAFTCLFDNVRFRGPGAPFKGNANRLSGVTGQVGVSLTQNAGDSKFIGCEWELLGVGVDNQTTINSFIACNWTSCLTAFQGGDPTGANRLSGVYISGGTMRGWGNYYIDASGTSYSWTIDGVFFDGQADKAVKVGNIVGSNGYGPWMFYINSPYISGALVDLELNAAYTTVIADGCMFGNSFTDGQSPTALTVANSGAYLNQGRLGAYTNLMGNDLAALLPTRPNWQKFSIATS